MEPIGLIGAGLLGSAMAERFITKGWAVVAFDPDRSACERIAALGGSIAASNAEVARQTRHIVISLPHSGITAEVLGEITPHIQPGTIVIDTTTGNPAEMAGFGAALAKQDIAYLDATVGGNSTQCRAGDVIVLVGGDPAAFEKAQEIWKAFAKRTFHLGPCGSGAQMKLVMNLALGLHRAVLAEALSFAERNGFDPAQTLEVLKEGPAYSRVMDLKGERMLQRNFTPEARLSQHLKDVRLILAEGERISADLPLSKLHQLLLERAEELGLGALDNSAILKVYD